MGQRRPLFWLAGTAAGALGLAALAYRVAHIPYPRFGLQRSTP